MVWWQEKGLSQFCVQIKKGEEIVNCSCAMCVEGVGLSPALWVRKWLIACVCGGEGGGRS